MITPAIATGIALVFIVTIVCIIALIALHIIDHIPSSMQQDNADINTYNIAMKDFCNKSAIMQ